MLNCHDEYVFCSGVRLESAETAEVEVDVVSQALEMLQDVQATLDLVM